jgi:tetratricopeptide (TPR) repeat protein
MSDSECTATRPADARPEIPKGAYESFLALAGLVFLLVVACVVAYGIYGRAMTAGLDRACAEAAFEAGKKHEALGNYEQAIQRFRQAMEGHFSNEEQRYMCGRSIGDLLLRRQRYSEAVAAYKALPPQAYASAGSLTGYVNALWHDGQVNEAERLGREWLKKAESEQNREQVMWADSTLMRICYQTNRLAEALDFGQAILAQDPANDAQLLVARILRQQGKKEESLSHLDAFLAQSTNTKLLDEARALRSEISGQ